MAHDGCHKISTIVKEVFEGEAGDRMEVFHTGKSAKNMYSKHVDAHCKPRMKSVKTAAGTRIPSDPAELQVSQSTASVCSFISSLLGSKEGSWCRIM